MDIGELNEISLILKNQVLDIFSISKSLKRFGIQRIRKITFRADGEIVKFSYAADNGVWRQVRFF